MSPLTHSSSGRHVEERYANHFQLRTGFSSKYLPWTIRLKSKVISFLHLTQEISQSMAYLLNQHHIKANYLLVRTAPGLSLRSREDRF